MKNTTKLIIAIVIPQVVGGSSAFFTYKNVNGWFNQQLVKPSWNPPGWLFGPVWTSLYVLMGIALYLVWKSDVTESLKKKAISLWAVQLFFNFWWSIIFFNAHAVGWALVEIVVLWLAILFTIFAFARVNKTAAWLLVPYISWVSFAAYLNYTIWVLNK